MRNPNCHFSRMTPSDPQFLDPANDGLSESYSGGVLNGMVITNQFDAELRRTSTTLPGGSGTICQANYTYDAASRLATVSDGNGNSAAYSYLANSPLVGQIAFAHSGTTEMTTIKQYDYLNRLTSISSSPSNAINYLYNQANQRTLDRLADGSLWPYGYDGLGQLTSGDKFWSDGTPVAGQQFGYNFDDIGNRLETEAGGDQTGANLRVAYYTNNTLNQITSRSVPGYVDVMGNALATNTVSVNGLVPYRKTEYFREQLPVTNTSSAVWDPVTVASPGQTSVTGNAYVAQTPEDYTYDADGNLTQDGRWNYTWDAENRLINLSSLSGAPTGSLLQLTFAYDYLGRRIQKIVSTNYSGSYFGEYTNKYAYDEWNCLATLNPALALVNSFLWGSDLSGSQEGAGGVGGLIKVSYYGASTTNSFVAYDGNGNVSVLINAADGTTLADYEYGPFGEVLRATGPMGKLNPFRFSTKYQDDETDFLYYGYRYYNPSTGRWLSRDPLSEKGGLNLYVFARNCPVSESDYLGLSGWEAGVVISGQIGYDVCQGTVSFTGWVWAGAGYEVGHTFYGPSYSWSGSYTASGGPHFNCGKCACCGSDSAGWSSSSDWNIVAPFLSGLGANGNVGAGLVITPDKCGVEVEGIVLIDLIKDGAVGPIGTALSYAAGFVGGRASAGVQLNVDVHFCHGASGGVVVDKASIAGGVFVDIGKTD